MTSDCPFQNFFSFFFFVPPDPKSEKSSRKSTNKKFWPKSYTFLQLNLSKAATQK